MTIKRVCLLFTIVMALIVLNPTEMLAQTASTSTVAGTVYDAKGALVPKAKVELLNIETAAKTTATSGAEGEFTFPTVPPGNYKITVAAQGFRQAVVTGVKVEVGKSALVNVTLEVGQLTEVVEVVASGGVELQTLDASIGNVLDSNLLSQLPTLSRDATSLLLLQPMAIPGFNGPGGSGEGNLAGGTVAGARGDQNTFMIDGGDATSNMEGGGGYNTGFIATPRAVVPTPVESLEEFRVATNNTGADFTRSAGAEVQMVTKRGTNDWHGAGYWYHQNDELNANDWFRNKRGPIGSSTCPLPFKTCDNPEWRDNRYGGKIGGPIWKNRTFFFLHEEERHFLTQAVFSRLSPTPELRAGIILYQDSVKGLVPVNITPVPVKIPTGNPNDTFAGQTIMPSGLDSTGSVCNVGATGCTPFDPRAGTLAYQSDPLHCSLSGCINPAIAAEWGLMPLPNDYSGGDGLRTAKFTAPEGNISNEHFAVLRLDHKINDKWNFMASYRYSVSNIQPPNIQEDISGTAPGCQVGTACALASRPLQPRFLVTGLTGQIKPNLINEFHFDWLRHWWTWIAPGARIALPGVNTSTNCPGITGACSDTALQIWRESRTDGMVPINVNTQQARQRVWNGRDFTWIDNLSWIKGKHNFQFGGRAQIEHFLHVRDDKVTGGITQPLYYVAKGGFFSNLGGIPHPGDLDSTNAVDSSTAFKRGYITALGLVDSATQVLTRAGDLTPNPPLTNIIQKENVDAYEVHFSDTWRVTPALTVSYGLTWGVQMPPYDPTGKTALMIDTTTCQGTNLKTCKLIDSVSYLKTKATDALNGVAFNPTLGYVPIGATGRKYPYDPDYSNVGPRVAVAWNPSFTSGLFGSVLGNKKSVIRAGYGRVFDRINGVGIVLTPALGIGFGDLSVCRTPDRTGACGLGGDPSSNFRIGVDGNHISPPSLPVVSNGVIIPGVNSIFENSDSRLDPRNKIGSSDEVDLSIQRELPGKMFLEVGYVGRIARNLFMNIDLNAIPYMFTPKSSMFGTRATNQTFADAFDKVAKQLQSGVNPNNVTAQPWFEAMLGGTGSAFCTGFSSCTVAAVQDDQANGNPYWPAHGAGALWTLIEPNFVTGPITVANTQVASIDWNTNRGYSNYHAGFITLRKTPTHGLTFDLNYTLSHSLDNLGFTQENTCAVADAYNVNRTYAPSLFDRRHTFNMLVAYELPLGKGKPWARGGVADKVLGGWSVSSVYTIASGLPLEVVDGNACDTAFGSTSNNGAPVGLIRTTSGTIGSSRINNPTLTCTPSPTGPGSNSCNGSPNAFGNPSQVIPQFRYPTFADNRLGLGAIRGLRRWNVDFAIAKTTHITERVSTRFDVQLVNAFNHPMFGGFSPNSCFGYENEAATDVSVPQTFGVLNQQYNSPRYIQMGLRFDF